MKGQELDVANGAISDLQKDLEENMRTGSDKMVEKEDFEIQVNLKPTTQEFSIQIDNKIRPRDSISKKSPHRNSKNFFALNVQNSSLDAS